MTKTIEVEIDDSGTVRPMDPVSRVIANAPIDDEPESEDERRAMAQSKAWLAQHPGQTVSHPDMAMLLSEPALAIDWLKPEEDEAWAYTQPDR